VLRPNGSSYAISGLAGRCASFAPGNNPGFSAVNPFAAMNEIRIMVSVKLTLITRSLSGQLLFQQQQRRSGN
jgi:hypothetical protein